MKTTNKKIEVVKPYSLYKWTTNFKRVQERFFDNQYKLRRIQQIEDFVALNNYRSVYHVHEVHLDLDIPETTDITTADLILVTHNGYSRYMVSLIKLIVGLILAQTCTFV
jgi:hypothetical protein